MLRKLKYLIFVSVLFCLTIECYKTHAQNKKIDSLSSLLKSSDNKAERINIHLKLSRLKTHSNSKEALIDINSADVLSKTLQNDSIKFQILSQYINYYFINQNYKNTFKYIDSALVFKDIVLPQKIVRLYTVLAQTSNFIGDYDQAITTYSTALKLCSENNLENTKIGILNGLSSIYLSKEDYINAKVNAEEAIKISKKNNRRLSEMYATLSLGHVYFGQKKYDDALKMYKIVETYLKENSSIILKHSTNTALGRWYKKDKQYDNAIFYFNENLKIDKSINNEIGINSNRSDIILVLILQKKYDKAITLLQKNLVQAYTINNPNLIRQNLLNLSEAYEVKKSFNKALEYRKLHEKWQDSIISASNLKAIGELETKYETEKREKEILQLSQTQLKNKVAIEKKNLWIKRLGFGFLIMLLLFSAGFIIFKQRSNYKKQKELITAITDTQIAEQKRISQDLHDSIGGSLALVKTKLTTLDKTETNHKPIEELIQTLKETSNEVRQISHDLMPGELVKFGLISAVSSLLNQIKNETFNTNLYAHNKDERIDSKVEIHVFRIIQELVQNVLKHANANTLNIYINKHPKALNLIVEDNGLGFDIKENELKGIGFKTIKNRVNYLNGQLKIDSQNGKGSSFNIQIPL